MNLSRHELDELSDIDNIRQYFSTFNIDLDKLLVSVRPDDGYNYEEILDILNSLTNRNPYQAVGLEREYYISLVLETVLREYYEKYRFTYVEAEKRNLKRISIEILSKSKSKFDSNISSISDDFKDVLIVFKEIRPVDGVYYYSILKKYIADDILYYWDIIRNLYRFNEYIFLPIETFQITELIDINLDASNLNLYSIESPEYINFYKAVFPESVTNMSIYNLKDLFKDGINSVFDNIIKEQINKLLSY